MRLLLNRKKIFLKCKLPIFAEIKLKGSNLHLIISLKYEYNSILFIKSKTEKSCAVDRLKMAYF